MADCKEGQCADESAINIVDDKLKGVCRIKPEYIIDENVRIVSEKCLPEDKEKTLDQTEKDEPSEKRRKIDVENGEKSQEINEPTVSPADKLSKEPSRRQNKREKLKGQNKARPPPYKITREHNLCPWIADQTTDELEKKCPLQKCVFMHDRIEYLKIKEPDISADCYVFNQTGKCPRGLACRFASGHITETGLSIVSEKYDSSKGTSTTTKNKIPATLQDKLRKHKYNFTKAEKIIKTVESARRKSDEAVKPTPPTSSEIPVEKTAAETPKTEETLEPRLGAVTDTDLIKLRSSEKKKIHWRDKILLSPLTTVGNLPFRRICKEYGADITCGEMALAPKVLKGAPEEWALVRRHECEDIFGVQLCGNNPGVLTRCAQLLNEQIDVDFIDLNLGCPIDLIYRQGGGSGMLTRQNVLQTVVQTVSQVLDIPLTIKTRTGIYMDKPIAHKLMPKFRDWGASMITVHGRSREQRYTKSADWEYIERCAAAAAPIPVFGNGDILSYDDYQRFRSAYPSVQGVTIGRGALIKPWIFTEIKEKKLIDISGSERLDIVRKYVHYGLEHWGSDTRGVETTRRFLLEWISFLHRYIPVGILEHPPQQINERPPFYKGRDEVETMLASSNCADWVKISEMFLGKVPEGFNFLPKHRANSWK